MLVPADEQVAAAGVINGIAGAGFSIISANPDISVVPATLVPFTVYLPLS